MCMCYLLKYIVESETEIFFCLIYNINKEVPGFRNSSSACLCFWYLLISKQCPSRFLAADFYQEFIMEWQPHLKNYILVHCVERISCCCESILGPYLSIRPVWWLYWHSPESLHVYHSWVPRNSGLCRMLVFLHADIIVILSLLL